MRRLQFSPAFVAFLLLLPVFIVPASAQQQVPLATEFIAPGVTGYADDIPKPEEIIGHQIGTAHTTPHQITEYFRVIDALSDRVVVEEHARTYEGRPLIHAIITSPANHARLEEIRHANLRLSDTPGDVSEADLDEMPAIIYQGFSIHGNEASGAEAGVLLFYHLAAGNGPAIDAALDSLVIILDPMFNPDGRDRFTDWANRNRGGVATTDGQDREHNEPWPGGRTNHYWFDLNRDWMPIQHPESQGRITLFHHWRPQLLTDHHEMGGNSTFFFQPGVPSRTNPNTLQRNQDLTAEIGEYHAAALDRIGQLYYTREGFDDFYYGKGSTYPDVNGAIGILFEQASTRALERETVNGVLSYAVTVRNQFATALSTVEAAVHMRKKFLAHMRDFYLEAVDLARTYPVKGYVVGLDRGRTRAQALAHVLQQHRIRVHELAEDVQADGKTFRAGSAYLIPMNQPQARLVKGVMERVTTFEDSLFYDISAWTLPLAFDLEYAELQRDVSRLSGAELSPGELDGGALIGERSDYAYLMEWGRYFAPRALYRLQKAGIRPVVMHEPITAIVNGQEQSFPRGTVVIPVAQRDVGPGAVHELARYIVDVDHVRVHAVDTGLTPAGPDLGSPSGDVLDKPKIALLTGSGTSSTNAGEAWHLLSERFRVPVSLVDADEVRSADLSRYNTLVMAGGFYGNVDADKVKEWVRSGGRLVAMASGARWALRNEMVELEERPLDLDTLFKDVPYADLNEAFGAQVIGGSIFEARLDRTHPLAYGMAETIPVFVRNRSAIYDPSDAPGANVAVLTDDPLMSGYISEEKMALIGGSATLVARRYGRGRVILFMDNPNFRAFWYGTNGLFLNAIFLGGSF
ncbi:MAG: M14 family zinc carboxypeptidase [Rhodothermales bacterium]